MARRPFKTAEHMQKLRWEASEKAGEAKREALADGLDEAAAERICTTIYSAILAELDDEYTAEIEQAQRDYDEEHEGDDE